MLALFRVASLRTGHTRFRVPGSPVIYNVSGGVAWMWTWQVPQTRRVLRRLFAMIFTHAGEMAAGHAVGDGVDVLGQNHVGGPVPRNARLLASRGQGRSFQRAHDHW